MSSAISTERLTLTALEPAAAAALVELATERAERILGAQLDAEFLATDVSDIFPIQAGLPAAFVDYGVWLILEREPARAVGSVGFMGPPDDAGLLEIGYGVIPSRHRRGYLTEAASALISWAFAQPGVSGIQARCAPDNVASIRSLERLGFVPVGAGHQYLSWLLRPAARVPAG